MNFAACSHPGRIRENNEDSYLILEKDGLDVCVLLVADGMGGHNFGEVASLMAVNVVSNYFDETNQRFFTNKDPEALLRAVIEKANQTIFYKAQQEEAMSGMGTTLVLGIIKDNELHICHVGDSRAYLYRQHQLQKLTTDHSFVEELVSLGTITPEEALVHPNRNIITRALGIREQVDPEYHRLLLQKDDVVLLCSDGLTNMVSEQTISEQLEEIQNPQDICDSLVRLANENGGEDNITVVICKK